MLALGSCSNDEVISTSSQADNNAITYSVMTNNATRSQTLYGASSALQTNFYVWACLNDATNSYPTYFESQEVIWDDEIYNEGDDSGNFKTGSTHYWPSAENPLNFIAVTANGESETFSQGTLTQTNVKMEPYAVNQLDELYAIKTNVTKTDADVVKGVLPLNFRHALAQLVFKIQNENPNIYVEVSEVRLCNIITKCNVSYVSTATTNTQYVDGTSSTSSNISNQYQTAACSWDTLHGGTYVQTIKDDVSGETTSTTVNFVSMEATTPEEVPYIKDGALYYAGKPYHNQFTLFYHEDFYQNDDAAHNVTSASFVIPQSYKKTETTKTKTENSQTKLDLDNADFGSYFLLKCAIRNVSNSDLPGYGDEDDLYLHGVASSGGEADGTRYILVPITENGSWDAGKKYVYTFTFKDGGDAGFSGGEDPEGPYDPDVPTLIAISYTKDSITIDDIATGTSTDVDVVTGITSD